MTFEEWRAALDAEDFYDNESLLRKAWFDSRKEEREACAKLCDAMPIRVGNDGIWRSEIKQAIRASAGKHSYTATGGQMNYNTDSELWREMRLGAGTGGKPIEVIAGHIVVGREVMARFDDSNAAIKCLLDAGYRRIEVPFMANRDLFDV